MADLLPPPEGIAAPLWDQIATEVQVLVQALRAQMTALQTQVADLATRLTSLLPSAVQ